MAARTRSASSSTDYDLFKTICPQYRFQINMATSVNLMPQQLWQPSAQRIADANITAFRLAVESEHGIELPDYAALYEWSISQPEQFWTKIWDFCGVVASEQGTAVVTHANKMPGAKWFPDARLNFAENLLQKTGGEPAIIFRAEDCVTRELSWDSLRQFTADGYFYNGKFHDSLAKVEEFLQLIRSVQKVVVVPFSDPHETLSLSLSNAVTFQEVLSSAPDTELTFTQLPFDHPLYVMWPVFNLLKHMIYLRYGPYSRPAQRSHLKALSMCIKT